MIYNPTLQRWEGNEHALTKFENPSTSTLPLHPTHPEDYTRHRHTNSIPSVLPGPNPFATLVPRDHNIIPPRQASPPRPALISQINNVRGVVVERGMVFDPQRMTWLKLDSRILSQHPEIQVGASPSSVVSFSVEEEEDVFAGMDDLIDEKTAKVAPGMGAAVSTDKENWVVGEEFDVGPAFVRRQKAEEVEWRKRVDKWMPGGVRREEGDEWRWEIRRVADRYDMRV
jgi:hypothetical protein